MGKNYGSGLDEVGHSIVVNTDESIVIVGSSGYFDGSVGHIFKFDKMGSFIWEYAHPNCNLFDLTIGLDGGYIAVGSYCIDLMNYDSYLLKINDTGVYSWSKRFDFNTMESAHSICPFNNIGYMISGHAGGYNGQAYVIKSNSLGDTLWVGRYRKGQHDNHGYSVIPTSDNGYVVAGITSGVSSMDVLVFKINSIGDTLWVKNYGGDDFEIGYSIIESNNDGYIVLGNTSSFGNGDVDIYMLKINKNGVIIWQKTYGGLNSDNGYCIISCSDGGYIIAGETESYGAGGRDAYILKINEAGDSLWAKTFGGTNDDGFNSVAICRDGGFVLTGYTDSFGNNRDLYIVKTDANGNVYK